MSVLPKLTEVRGKVISSRIVTNGPLGDAGPGRSVKRSSFYTRSDDTLCAMREAGDRCVVRSGDQPLAPTKTTLVTAFNFAT
jgi:hypothetical protein